MGEETYDDKAVIWALESEALNNESEQAAKVVDKTIERSVMNDVSLSYCDEQLRKDCAILHNIIENNEPTGIYATTPFRLNDRLTIQQGRFVVPCNIRKSFWENINVDGKLRDGKMKAYVLIINKRFHKDLLDELRQMNINSSVLFPGLQGFSESLWIRAARPLSERLAGSDQSRKLKLFFEFQRCRDLSSSEPDLEHTVP